MIIFKIIYFVKKTLENYTTIFLSLEDDLNFEFFFVTTLINYFIKNVLIFGNILYFFLKIFGYN